MRYAECATCMGEMRNVYKILIEKLEGKRPLRIPRCGLREISWVWTGCIWLRIGATGMLS
jgi:hypothetical protein